MCSKWKKKQQQNDLHRSQQAAMAIARKIDQVQRLWATWMSRQANRISMGTKKMLLVLFVLLIGSYCCLLITGHFQGGVSNGNLEHGAIQTPVLPKNQENKRSAHMEAAATQRIQQFRRYIDSLEQTPAGQKERERLFKARPGLLDSLTLWESLHPASRGDEAWVAPVKTE